MLSKRYRRRAGPYAVVQKSPWPGLLRRIAGVIVFIFVLFYVGKLVLGIFGVGNNIRHTAVVLQPESRGTVSVSLEGGSLKNAESELKLYPGDRVVTGNAANAVLSFFDGTDIRMDENTDVGVETSAMGEEESEFELSMTDGSLWVQTPSARDFEGMILRKIETPSYSVLIPSRTEMVLTDVSVIVYTADGLGVSVSVDGNDPISIGEGQKFIMPNGADTTGDLYRYRSPLDPTAVQSPFVTESREIVKDEAPRTGTGTSSASAMGSDGDPLTVTSPADNIEIDASTVTVSGRVSSEVSVVRANGYVMPIDETARTFSQELALSDSEEVEIKIEALDKESNLVAEVIRTVRRNREPPAPPTITSPSAAGSIYQTTQGSIEITGTAAAGTVGIVVNDYRLQLFKPGDTKWSYLASIELGNMKEGQNVYTITAINAGGYKSEPVTVTITKVQEGTEGVVQEAPASSAPSEGGTSSSVSSAPETQAGLPQNDPLMPGSLTISAPSAGTEHTETQQTELLIEGSTPVETESVWVNDYRLQLYEPGKDFWNYIASVELQTMKRGTNTYNIVTRNKAGEILDTLTYTIIYQPE